MCQCHCQADWPWPWLSCCAVAGGAIHPTCLCGCHSRYDVSAVTSEERALCVLVYFCLWRAHTPACQCPANSCCYRNVILWSLLDVVWSDLCERIVMMEVTYFAVRVVECDDDGILCERCVRYGDVRMGVSDGVGVISVNVVTPSALTGRLGIFLSHDCVLLCTV